MHGEDESEEREFDEAESRDEAAIAIAEATELPALPDILFVAEAELHMQTTDRATADMVSSGYRYLVAKEFATFEPVLARFYEPEFHFKGRTRGSFHDRFTIRFKLKREARPLKRRLRAIQSDGKKDSNAAAIIALMSALIGLGSTAMSVWEKRIEAQMKAQERVEQQLKQNHPSVQIEINVKFRPANSSDEPPGKSSGQSFDL
jgi:hypothetical protein